ncbi:MAG: 6-phosphogluconolactonase [Candidatus Cloacimonetes bacterium]|nr:6-phosphogluconolactonase [Candidatus Cloacimonadota bacterium]
MKNKMYFFNTDRLVLDDIAASLIEKEINRLKKREITLAIPGGRSVAGIFHKLKNKSIDWQKVHIFMVDERIVPIDDPESNFHLATEIFLNNLVESKKLPKKNIHPFIMDNSKEDHGVSCYEEDLLRISENFDIVLLSSGEDGHIGALFPDHHSIKNNSEFFLHIKDSPKPPSERITMSRQLLLRSGGVLLIFYGESKRDALNRFRDRSVKPDSCPCKYVNKIKHSYILSDLENM